MKKGCISKLPFIAYKQNVFLIHYKTVYTVHYKITQLKSDKSTLWKLWRGHNEYDNMQGVLFYVGLWQVETMF